MPKPTNNFIIEDNKAIIQSLKEEHVAAFDFVYRYYYKRLCSFCSQYINEKEECENIVHDTMMWLWENRQSLMEELSLKTLLFTIVKNKALNHISHFEIKARVYKDIASKYESEFADPDLYMNEELFTLYRKAMAQLPQEVRQAFEMNRKMHLTHKEIAERLGVSPQTVNYRIGLALKQLRIALRDYLPMFLLLSTINLSAANKHSSSTLYILSNTEIKGILGILH